MDSCLYHKHTALLYFLVAIVVTAVSRTVVILAVVAVKNVAVAINWTTDPDSSPGYS